jgi:hypothetical protein
LFRERDHEHISGAESRIQHIRSKFELRNGVPVTQTPRAVRCEEQEPGFVQPIFKRTRSWYDQSCGRDSRIKCLQAESVANMATAADSHPRRRFLRLSIRSLIVLVLAIGAALGWIVRQAHPQREAVTAIVKAGGMVDYKIYPGAPAFSWTKPASWSSRIGEHIGIDFVDHVAYVQFTNQPNTNDTERRRALARLPDVGRLETLNLAGASITDDDLAELDGLSHLEHLMLQNTAITDAGLAHVRNLTSLQEIYIRNTPIGDDGLTHFQRLTSLTHLTISRNKVTDVGLERLKDLHSLQNLDVAYTQISDAGLEHLAALSNLDTLKLAGTRITDRGLAHLKRLTKLSSLDLSGTRVTDAGLERLKGLTNLSELDLSKTKVTDAGVVDLKKLKKLSRVDVFGTRVTAAGIGQLHLPPPKPPLMF